MIKNDHVYDERLHSKNINICQFERNPDFETTIRARLNTKHIDERARIIQETTNKISQTISWWWHVCRWGWVGPNTGESFGRVARGKVSIAIVILLDGLHEMILLDRYVEMKGLTHRCNNVCLYWDWFGNSVIPIHLCIWNFLRYLRILLRVTARKETSQTMAIAYRWWGRVVFRIVIGCLDVSWMQHFTVHSHWLSGALLMDTFKLLVITGHMRVLMYKIHVLATTMSGAASNATR